MYKCMFINPVLQIFSSIGNCFCVQSVFGDLSLKSPPSIIFFKYISYIWIFIKYFLEEAIVERRRLLVHNRSSGTWAWNSSLEAETSPTLDFLLISEKYGFSNNLNFQQIFLALLTLLLEAKQPLPSFAAHFPSTWFCRQCLTIKHSAPASSSVHYSFYSCGSCTKPWSLFTCKWVVCTCEL